MEPTAKFLVAMNTSINNLNISPDCCPSDGMFVAGKPFNPVNNFKEFTACVIGVNRALTKENPFVFNIKVRESNQNGLAIISGVYHVKGPQNIEQIPLMNM